MPNTTCSIDGCERKVQARGWCATHYMRNRKHGSPHANFAPKRTVKPPCLADGCELISRGWHGYCATHYTRVKKHGDPTIDKRATGRKVCIIPECAGLVEGHGLCSKHWTRNKRTGSPDIVRPVPAWDASPHWKGLEASYSAIHIRLRKLNGKASSHSCVDCHAAAQHWSYDMKDPNEIVEGILAYSLDPAHYAPRCVSCHKVYDLTQ